MMDARTSTSLPKRDELWLRIVFALPNASSMGFACNSRCSTPPIEPAT